MPRQLSLDLGRRKRGSKPLGRPRIYRSRMAHRERERIPGRCPVHVTLKVRKDVPRLRSRKMVRAFRSTLAPACERGEFRVVHYSLQSDHVHLLVEAKGKEALARGMKSVGARFARAVNRVYGRSGPVLRERFHHRVLRTPREVRSALAYVLLNVRRHWRQRTKAAPPVQLDEASSGQWFEGWSRRPPPPAVRISELRDVAPPRTWLLSTGWRRHGLVDPAEVPGS